ncbi:hypothetical protein HfxHF1_120 [Halophage HF1]|uniref:Uncharacterized protein n=2 Tax=Haloferacalesvirus TaxID=2843389 RepID=Q8V6U0_9CAUD|nr:hypothetical protein HrrHF2_120 [Halorubrum phage HF2]NP_861605.1 hypothetical protein HfxHF1_120 [Halophage HF1]AAL54939.1 hypothetical protein HrrHF2_120 [Halorubrum phage HF2]AAO61316.1 hypothetical protein HfxHF1_120 [Halophage HF1]QIR31143.1 hypothetical protein HrrHc2_540 [Halorubrum virus Hardycor2]
MSNKYDTFEAYVKEVQSTAKRYYDFALEGAEEIRTPAFDPPELPDEIPDWAIAEAAIENHELLMYYQRCVVYHCDNGFYGEGGDRYYHDPEDQADALEDLAYAGFYNDIISKIRFIRSLREDLGDAIQLIEGPLHGKGVRYEYDYYVHLSSEDPLTYIIESLGQSEWRMYDPDGTPFEVISPRVAVNNADRPIPEYSLKLFLDNICARQERKRETSE